MSTHKGEGEDPFEVAAQLGLATDKDDAAQMFKEGLDKLKEIERSQDDGPELEEAVWCFIAQNFECLEPVKAGQLVLGRSVPKAVLSKVHLASEALDILLPDCQDAQSRRDLFTHFWGIVGHYQTTRRIQDDRSATTVAGLLEKLIGIEGLARRLGVQFAGLRDHGDADFITETLERNFMLVENVTALNAAIDMAKSRVPPRDEEDDWGEYSFEAELRSVQNFCQQATEAIRNNLPDKTNPGKISTVTHFGTPKKVLIRHLLELFGETAERLGVYDEDKLKQFLDISEKLAGSNCMKERKRYMPLFKMQFDRGPPPMLACDSIDFDAEYRAQAQDLQDKIDRISRVKS